MQTKNVLYATVGAPVVAARKVGEGVTVLRSKISEGTSGYGQVADKAIDSWAVEGEKVVARITDGKVVDEITAKVDLDQAKEQVSKLRDQLEDMLATWRSSFRPEKAADKEAPAKAPRQEAGLQDRHHRLLLPRPPGRRQRRRALRRPNRRKPTRLPELTPPQRDEGALRGPFFVPEVPGATYGARPTKKR